MTTAKDNMPIAEYMSELNTLIKQQKAFVAKWKHFAEDKDSPYQGIRDGSLRRMLRDSESMILNMEADIQRCKEETA